jgi:hypothetical protein
VRRTVLGSICIILVCIFVVSCTTVKPNELTGLKTATDSVTAVIPVTEHEVVMDKEMKRKINIFLSNFSECFFDNFNIVEAKDDELIRFAVSHNYKNNNQLWLPGDSDITTKIDVKFIEKTIEKYFNITEINHKSVGNEIVYRDDFYFIQQAAGEVIPFVQVNKLVQGENGILIAYGDEYGNANFLSKEDPYEPLEYWSDDERKEIELYNGMKAEFKEIESNGQKSFLLIKYNSIQ